MNPVQIPGARAHRLGSATLIALGMGIVLLIIIAGVRSFTSYRIQNTIQESRNLKALAIAEGGVAFIITELANNYSFLTHKVNPNLSWGTDEATGQTLQADPNFKFSVKAANRGTYSGTLGEGEFKVRCGPIPCQDDPRTKNIDESKSFFKVESMGKIGDTIRVINAVVQRRYPGREFLLYDGGFLSIVYGEPGENNINKFSTGHLYGHKGIEIGRILLRNHAPCPPGTNQELFNMNSLISGDGGIFFYNPIKAQFRPRNGLPALDTTIPKNADFPRNGTYSSRDAETHGEYPKELLEETPEIPDKANLGDRIKDKHAHISIPPKPIPFETYQKQAAAQGLYIRASDCSLDYPVTPGWSATGNSVKVKVLDFGTQLHQGNVTLPANFNGVIFSDGNLVIKGNPPRDVKIISRKDVFVAGDFNQAGDPSQKKQRYGFPQNYDRNAMESDDYKTTSQQLLLDDTQPSSFKNHQAATVIAHDRVVYDYRSPLDCFENELYPFMKYQIGTALKDANSAKNSILKDTGTGGIQTSAADSAEVKNRIASYFEKFPLLENADETALADQFGQSRDTSNSSIFSDAELERLSKEVWKKYRERYEAKRMEADTSPGEVGKFGIYKLLTSLRRELRNGSAWKQDADDDYLYFPEMTTNGMFISCGKRNRTFYAGPDYIKLYDEIGRNNSCVTAGVGLRHSDMTEMVHRVYGSEIRLDLYDIRRIDQDSYQPPTRRKLYDTTLPKLSLDSGSADFAAFRLLTWQDLRAMPTEFAAF